jgi:acyl carrier protein
MTNLEIELRDKILKRLNLSHIEPGTISGDTVLFNEGIGLDSLDALELGILVEQDYGIVIGVAERGRSIFGTLGDLARFVEQNLHRDHPKP